MLMATADGWKFFAPFSIDAGRGNGHVFGSHVRWHLYDECSCALFRNVYGLAEASVLVACGCCHVVVLGMQVLY
jgi:hypothetical protein